jgi:hypothetical protein
MESWLTEVKGGTQLIRELLVLANRPYNLYGGKRRRLTLVLETLL